MQERNTLDNIMQMLTTYGGEWQMECYMAWYGVVWCGMMCYGMCI